MKYHINNENKVGVCRAKKSCRFGGNTGFDNHYTDKKEALEAASKQIAKEFSSTTTSASKKFIENTENLKNLIISYGFKKSSELPPVSNNSEIIKKWFNNDKANYNNFKKLIENDSLNSNSKKSIAYLMSKNIDIEVVSLKNLKNNSDFSNSVVEIFEDTPENNMSLDDIINGKLPGITIGK